MRNHRAIIHKETGKTLVEQAKWCHSFWNKLQGFMFKSELKISDALVLVDKRDNRVSTAIHMFFVNFELGVAWVNGAGEVVDIVVAKPWKPNYTPIAAARYVIEMHPDLLKELSIGDHVEFK